MQSRHRAGLFRQAFDRDDMFAVMHHRERQTTIDATAFQQHGAGAALAVVAALFRAGGMQMIAQGIEQGGARIDLQIALHAVHMQRHRQCRNRRRARDGIRMFRMARIVGHGQNGRMGLIVHGFTSDEWRPNGRCNISMGAAPGCEVLMKNGFFFDFRAPRHFEYSAVSLAVLFRQSVRHPRYAAGTR